jgi:hypothetical protein
MRPVDPRLLDETLLRLAAKRRLHRKATGGRRYQLHVVYVGGEPPPTDDAWSLTVVLHQPWCSAPGHAGACEPAPE